ncbi:MAG: hypothetical protein IH596_06390 [Bacteroidales bacterium]|nr:hypothetical protein [Bacteroidales bacterium]
MKKLLSIILLGGFIILVLGNCKKKEEPQPDQVVKYTVSYSLQLTGDFKDLKIEYFETAMAKKEITSPAVPWQASFTNFVPGDSVAMRVTFVVPAGPFTYDWTWNIYATGGVATLDYGNHMKVTSSTAEDMPVVINTWKGKLP